MLVRNGDGVQDGLRDSIECLEEDHVHLKNIFFHDSCRLASLKYNDHSDPAKNHNVRMKSYSMKLKKKFSKK